MPDAISPVYAPKLCSLIFCAPRRILVLRMAFETSDKAVKGGQTTMSTSFTLLNSRLSPATRSSPSATVLFIFQLAAMINLRSLSMRLLDFLFLVLRQRRHPGQHLAFQKFQTRPAPCTHKSHFIT